MKKIEVIVIKKEIRFIKGRPGLKSFVMNWENLWPILGR